jgi:hypothetical protein
VGELRKLYYERLEEADLEIERQNNRTEVENLLQLGDQSLNLHDYLPLDLADPLSLWCKWLSMRPEVALTALLAGASSLHKVGTELVIHRNQNFRVPPTIFAALVSESGQKKSPIFSNIIYQPLGQLRSEKVDAYKAAMQDYEMELESWDKSGRQGPKPTEPSEAVLYYFTNATGEAIPVQATKAPEKALLALIDELSGLLRSENSYRNGRGSDRQDILSYFDGTGQTGLRASGIKTEVERIYLSIYGTIQPAVLKGHMADCSDPDGQWARFLFVNQPTVAATLSDDDGQAVQVRDRIADFYRHIDRLPEMEYYLSRDAFKRYQRIYNQLERLRVTHPKPGMRAVYSKMEGYIGRLAVNLHVLWEIGSGKACPSEEISLFILKKAIQLAKFFIGQVQLIHAHSDNDELAPHIIRLIELSKRLDCNGANGWIKAKQYQETFPKKQRPSAQQARDWMLEAVTLGYGCTRGSGNRLLYHWKSDNNNNPDNNPTPPLTDNLGNLGKLGEDLGKGVPQVKTLTNQGIEENVGNLGKGIPHFGKDLINNPDNPPDIVVDFENEIIQEGGYFPQPSPTVRQEPQNLEESSDSALGNNLGNPSPTLPQVPQACASSAVACVTVEPVMRQSAQVPQISPKLQLAQSEQSVQVADIAEENLDQMSPASFQAIATPAPFDFSALMRESQREVTRLKWSKQEGSAYLKATYGKHGRYVLTDEELVEFVTYLKSLPTPSDDSEEAICASLFTRFAIATPEPAQTLNSNSVPDAELESCQQVIASPTPIETLNSDSESELEFGQAIAPAPTPVEIPLPIYQRSDGGFEVVQQKLRKFHYVGRFIPQFTDLDGNVIVANPEVVLVETRRSVKPEYAHVKPEEVDCEDQGIRLENLKEIS